MNREDKFKSIKDQPEVDVLVIGGGINGIGTFRDLALQGIRIVLAEKYDFCSGASAGSSHMLHGGIRYLENAEFRLVREALQERNRMFRNAPHYSKPLPTTIPMFRWLSGALNAPLKFLGIMDKPSERGALIIKAGLTMYDFYTRGDDVTPNHDFAFKDESLKKYPNLNPDIVCTATYYDGWMPYPERICIDLIRDAENANGDAIALNYLGASDGDADTVTLTDEITGETYTVKPKVVINAAGPWIDFVNRAMGKETKFIGGTKGSHLMLDHPELHAACGGTEFFFENNDGRIVLIFPFHNRVMVGTTDIRIENPEEAVCTDDEIDYILGMIPKVFPSLDVNRSHIVYTFSGVRPLPSSEDSRTGTISRDHSIRTVDQATSGFNYPVHALVGGKWTSWRAFSEEAAKETLGDLNKKRNIDTKYLAIGGGRNYPKDEAGQAIWLQNLQQNTELPLEQLEILFERYGTYAKEVAQFISAENDNSLQHIPNYTQREVEFIAQTEYIEHLDDFLQRRSALAILGYGTSQAMDELAHVIGDAIGWDADKIQAEIDRTHDLFTRKHRMDIAQPVNA
ncbi:MAG: glycerol-3-phosphate dehydrogenase/oxidase [Phototrophicaceae bacterium]